MVNTLKMSDEVDDPTYGETTEIQRRAKVQALLLQHFWSRWKREYLTALRKFHHTTGTNTQTVKVGDVVLIHDNMTFQGYSGSWP